MSKIQLPDIAISLSSEQIKIKDSKEYKKALTVSRQPSLLKAMEQALDNKELRDLAIKDRMKFTSMHGIEVPEGLQIEFSINPEKLKPEPGINWFEIKWFSCRTFFVKDDPNDPSTWHTETVCFGHRVIKRIPRGGPAM